MRGEKGTSLITHISINASIISMEWPGRFRGIRLCCPY